jgi:hypothetical protein
MKISLTGAIEMRIQVVIKIKVSGSQQNMGIAHVEIEKSKGK